MHLAAAAIVVVIVVAAAVVIVVPTAAKEEKQDDNPPAAVVIADAANAAVIVAAAVVIVVPTAANEKQDDDPPTVVPTENTAVTAIAHIVASLFNKRAALLLRYSTRIRQFVCRPAWKITAGAPDYGPGAIEVAGRLWYDRITVSKALLFSERRRAYDKLQHGQGRGPLQKPGVYLRRFRDIWRLGQYLGLWPAGRGVQKQRKKSLVA
jgi:hypothetical protein